MATFLAHIRIHPGQEAAFEETAAQIWEATHREEPGCRRYEYYRTATPGTYYTLGSFDDYEGFITHQVSDHHVAATTVFRGMIADLRLEWLDPVVAASGLAPTEMTEPRADASDMAKMYATRQPAEMQSWWAPLR
jgi:quinol monooxygenase YgiN